MAAQNQSAENFREIFRCTAIVGVAASVITLIAKTIEPRLRPEAVLAGTILSLVNIYGFAFLIRTLLGAGARPFVFVAISLGKLPFILIALFLFSLLGKMFLLCSLVGFLSFLPASLWIANREYRKPLPDPEVFED